MPLVGDGHHPLREDRLGRVLAGLELVADDRELGGEVLGLDGAIDHAVGLETDGELEVLIAGGQGLEVVGPVHVGRAVELGPALLHGPGDVRVGRRPLEDHVLQQVGHAGLAVALVPRADQDGQVDGHLGTRRVGEQEDAQAVVQPVLGDPFHRRDLRRAIGVGGGHAEDQPAPWRKAKQPGKCLRLDLIGIPSVAYGIGWDQVVELRLPAFRPRDWEKWHPHDPSRIEIHA